MGMTREEFAVIVKGLRTVYTNENFIKDGDAFNMWYQLLKDLDYKQLAAGTQKYMQTERRIPTPADLRKASILEKDISEGEVWSMVSKAITRSSYNSQEEFDKLPEDVKRAVGSPNQLHLWAISEDTNMEVVQSQVLRSYRQVKDKSRVDELVNPNVSRMLKNNQQQAIGVNNDL